MYLYTACVCVRMYVCVCVCVHMYVCVCVHRNKVTRCSDHVSALNLHNSYSVNRAVNNGVFDLFNTMTKVHIIIYAGKSNIAIYTSAGSVQGGLLCYYYYYLSISVCGRGLPPLSGRPCLITATVAVLLTLVQLLSSLQGIHHSLLHTYTQHGLYSTY